MSAAQAYRVWAPHYETDNPVTALEEDAVNQLTPAVAGRALLDVGCGTGRRLRKVRSDNPSKAMGIDLVHQMLRENSDPWSKARTSVADMRWMPVRSQTFDMVWCRLAIGHVSHLPTVYREFARVINRCGTVIVTDFHPDAVAAGHTRTFPDADGVVRTVEHFVHTTEHHEEAAAAHGLKLDSRLDQCIGPTVENMYRAAGKASQYVQQQGLRLVLALRFTL